MVRAILQQPGEAISAGVASAHSNDDLTVYSD
jgi:hypothetical protein